MAPFDWSYTTFYWYDIVNIAILYRFWVIWHWIISWPWNLGQRSLKIIQNGTIRKLGCGFLFAFHSNYGSILHQFRDKSRYLSQIVIFSYPLCIRRPRQRVLIYGFHHFWHTRIILGHFRYVWHTSCVWYTEDSEFCYTGRTFVHFTLYKFNPELRYNYLRFGKTDARHLKILLPVLISSISQSMSFCTRLSNFLQTGPSSVELWC